MAEPQLLTPSTAHPAFAKAAKYLDVEHVLVPVGDDGRADVAATVAAIGRAHRARRRIGALLPVRRHRPDHRARRRGGRTGRPVPHRRLPRRLAAAVVGAARPAGRRRGTSGSPASRRISADIHKYGYTFKGASIVAYRSRDLLERQFFWYDDWPGGLYASGTPAGTRPAPPIAGAWAAINLLGADGYLRMAQQVLEATTRFRAGIDAIDGVTITGAPDMSVMELTTDPASDIAVDIGGIGDVMDDRGWHLDRQQGGLHLMLSPYHLADRRPLPRRPRRRGRRARPEPRQGRHLRGRGLTFAGQPVRCRPHRGPSSRMGRDKALIEVDGVPMAKRVADALAAGGARPGALHRRRPGGAGGARPRVDRPTTTRVRVRSAGFLTALEWVDDGPWDTVVVSACDHPWLDGETVENLLFGLIKAPLARPADRP